MELLYCMYSHRSIQRQYIYIITYPVNKSRESSECLSEFAKKPREIQGKPGECDQPWSNDNVNLAETTTKANRI